MTNDIQIIVADSFEHEAKKLIKRYRSLKNELAELIENMKVNPFQGVDLGGGVRKIRLAISSKGKGKNCCIFTINLNNQQSATSRFKNFLKKQG